MSAMERILQNFPQNTDALLITSDVNRLYVTQFKSSAGVVLILPDKAYLLIDFRYYEKASQVVKDCEVVMMTDMAAQLSELCKKHGVKRLSLESRSVTVSECAAYQKVLPVRVLADDTVSNLLDSLRIIKTQEEIDKIVQAQRIAEQAYTHILDFIRPGRTEKEIALELDYFMLRNGAEALSFDTIAVSGTHSSLPHGVPSEKPVEVGDFVTMDYGAVVDGYHSDMTRTVAVGAVSDKMREVYELVLRANEAALEAARAGITGKKFDAVARDIIDQAGYGDCFGHSLGHGVGLEIHELPNASVRSNAILRDGMIVTVEPGVYLPGQFGVRIEDMVVIRENGYENLTKAPKNLICL